MISSKRIMRGGRTSSNCPDRFDGYRGTSPMSSDRYRHAERRAIDRARREQVAKAIDAFGGK